MSTAALERLEMKVDRLTDIVNGKTIGVHEAAQILGIGDREVRRRAREGKLLCLPNTKPYRFFVRDVIGR